MWDADTTVKDWIGLPVHRKKLFERVRTCFDIPSKGVAIVIDNHNYEDYSNPVWKNQGLHMNIQYGGVEEMSPKDLLKILESGEYAHLVWISRRVAESKDIEFSWILAHELRHLEQDLITFTLSRARLFLRDTLGGTDIEPRITLVIPTELDAELAAWRTARSLFGIKSADSYVSDMASSYPAFRSLGSHDPEEPYNVVIHTVELLKKYQSQLEKVQRNSKDNIIQRFNIDEVCQELIRKG